MPPGKKVISSKLVFKKKIDETGIVKFKCRLVARGCEQETDCDWNELYAPVANLPTLKCLIAVANKLNLPLHQMDVCSAFLDGDIKADVYIKLPKYFPVDDPNIVCKLNKSIYGLKKSPKYWNEKFDSVVISNGYIQSENDSCLYSKCDTSSKLYLLLYVDDILLFGTDEREVEHIKHILTKNFKMKDLGLDILIEYLGINIQQNLNKGMTVINRTTYLKKVLNKFGMTHCKPASTPLDKNFDFVLLNRESSENAEIEFKCRRLVGSLIYAVSGTRPDVCASVCLLSRYQHRAFTLL